MDINLFSNKIISLLVGLDIENGKFKINHISNNASSFFKYKYHEF